MTDPVLSELAKSVASQGPLFAVLIAIIVLGVRAVWVPGFAYKQMKDERDQATATLDKFVGVHETQTDAIERNTKTLEDVCRRLEKIEEAQQRRGRAS